ncbi:flagellar hook-length control protein FliK [Thalassoglobus sp. JC818]|uniref:flagellar hook-length control protein FliK n=1 Tax=Thalassoglobus sp. JC818 TaxID=3232136 RepID=UPI003459AB4F
MDVSANLMKLQQPRQDSSWAEKSHTVNDTDAEVEETDAFDDILIALNVEELDSLPLAFEFDSVDQSLEPDGFHLVDFEESQDLSESSLFASEQLTFDDLNVYEVIPDEQPTHPGEFEANPLTVDDSSEVVKPHIASFDVHQPVPFDEKQELNVDTQLETTEETSSDTLLNSETDSHVELNSDVEINDEQLKFKQDGSEQTSLDFDHAFLSESLDSEVVNSRTSEIPSQRSFSPQKVASRMVNEALNHSAQLKSHSEVEFSMRLDPPELGAVIVRMRRSEQKIVMTVQAVDPETQTLIDDNFSQLRDLLSEHDAQVDFQQSSTQSGSEQFEESSRPTLRLPSVQREDTEKGHNMQLNSNSGALDFRA